MHTVGSYLQIVLGHDIHPHLFIRWDILLADTFLHQSAQRKARLYQRNFGGIAERDVAQFREIRSQVIQFIVRTCQYALFALFVLHHPLITHKRHTHLQRRYRPFQFVNHRVQKFLSDSLDVPLLADSQYLIDQTEDKEEREQYGNQ